MYNVSIFRNVIMNPPVQLMYANKKRETVPEKQTKAKRNGSVA
jgi:hypothetical protein